MHSPWLDDTRFRGTTLLGLNFRGFVEEGALVARPGFGDLLTLEDYGDYHLHLDFLLPGSDARAAPEFAGQSGVYVSGRWELALAHSQGQELSETSSGALAGTSAPLVDAAGALGAWQSLDLTYEHRAGGEARLSAWLNGQRVQDDVLLEEHSPYGFVAAMAGSEAGEGQDEARFHASAEDSERCGWDEGDFVVRARFRTGDDGTLVSKCPPEGEWVPDAKALFLRNGRLVYDIGWVGAMQSRRRYDDEEWHVAVLRGVDEGAQLFVDGELVAEREDFTAENDNEFVFKVGAANEDFGGTQYGEIENVAYWAHGLSEEEARAQSELEDWRAGEFRPDFHWDPDPEAVAPPQAGDVLRAPIRLQADSSEVRFANIWVAPLGEVAHASIIEGWNEDTLARGAEVYAGTCLACHGPDGERTLNPQARPFATAPLQNGSDPRSLYETIRGGFREMPSNEWLEPEDTYAVVQYIRETFLRERNAEQYFAVDGAYLAGLPKGRRHGLAAGEADELPPRDYGPALGAQLGRAIGSGLAIPLGRGVTLGYDLQTMSSPGAWDGFLQLANTQHYQQRGEAIAQPAEETQPGLDGYGWGFEGTLDWDRARRPARGPLPADWLDYRGYHDGEHGLVLESYVEGRHVYERPGLDRAAGIDVISHRYSVGGGERELVLQLARAPEGWDGALAQFSLAAEDGRLGAEVLLLGKSTGDLLEPFTALALIGVESGLELDEEGRVALRIAPALERQEFYVLRYGSPWGDEADAFVNLVDNRREGALPPSADQDLARAEQRWPEVFETRGELGEGDGAYVVDTLPLPPENPWNAWFRTSALAFFNDGRAAVTTYGGDVWIVDGIDADLDVLRWKRFAAGLFEPMGALVVDGKVLVTCRDRIVRLHDTDGNGEADRYESFFPDPDTTASFHSFSFDLQRDAQGFLYYAKSGQYTDYALPGSILKVAPDGRSHEVYSTGLRTPNGMGMSPDGRPLVSDNQGNWIPASKVSLSFPGAFHGVFRSINTGGAGEQTRDTFDRPVIWMPQRLDSSSGGQLWVDDERFGPLSGRYLHTSFGKGWMYPLVIDVVDGVEQAAVWRLPFQFDAGLQRLRKNPIDGQVYAVGLSGWQGPGGGQDGCLQRVRWTGRDVPLLVGARSTSVGIELEFSGPLDAQALDLERFRAKRWNYEWARRYGSAHWSVAQPGREGEDEVDVLALSLSADGRRLDLQLADMVECDQLVLDFRATALGGEEIAEEVFLTVNRVPGP